MIYLDNAASTRVHPDVAAKVCKCMQEDYGNPSSAHHYGVTADRLVRTATEQLLAAIGDPQGELGTIVWTSGGTESDALGVLGAAAARSRQATKVVLSAVEHSAVRESAAQLSERGWVAERVPVSVQGVVDIDAFANMCADASVAALMLVNNEIGTIQPVRSASDAARKKNSEIHIHCDAVQGLGKIEINVGELGADSVAFAAHKLHGPKGVGALWLRKGAHIKPLWGGGGHQGGLRSGTLNVPGIAGFGLATSLACDALDDCTARFADYGQRLLSAAAASGAVTKLNAAKAPRAPHVVSIAIAGAPAEPLLHVLESRGVMVSAGSACAERDRRPSPVLSAIALGPDFGTLRFSFGRDTTSEEIDAAAEILKDAIRTFV